MEPDNDHLHNRVHSFFKTLFKSKTAVNSATGVSIALGSSGFALAGYLSGFILITSDLWLWVFALQGFLYGAVFFSLGKTKITINNGIAV